jgi:hypothetical protein
MSEKGITTILKRDQGMSEMDIQTCLKRHQDMSERVFRHV